MKQILCPDHQSSERFQDCSIFWVFGFLFQLFLGCWFLTSLQSLSQRWGSKKVLPDAAPEARLLLGWPFHYSEFEWLATPALPHRWAEEGKCWIISMQNAEKVRIIHSAQGWMCTEVTHSHNLSFLPSKEVLFFPHPLPALSNPLFFKMLMVFMDFHRPVCRSNKIQGEILETFQHSLLSKNHFKCLTLAQFFTPFPLKIWKEVLHEYCKRQPAKNCRQSELGSLFPLVKPAREKKGKQQRFLKVAFYSVLSAAGWKIQNNDQNFFFSWKFHVQLFNISCY